MPPRTRKPDPAEESVLDQMNEDVDAPIDYPPGAPEFKVLLAVRPRSRRGDFKRLLAEIAAGSDLARDTQDAMNKLKDERLRNQAMFRLSACLDDVMELIEKALRLVAVDVEKFDTWVADVDDDDLQATWNAYQNRAQPGEASSSAS